MALDAILIFLILIPNGHGSDIDEKLEEIISVQERMDNVLSNNNEEIAECHSRSSLMQQYVMQAIDVSTLLQYTYDICR